MLSIYSFVNLQIEKLRSDTRGVTALEYGLIASLVAVVLVVTVTTLGTNLKSVFSAVSTSLVTKTS